MKYFVTAIGTDSGKTLVSAILCEALEADYWKPVQSGAPYDSDTVRSLLTNTKSIIHPEAFRLNTPASPHASAKIDGVEISLDQIHLPKEASRLIVEGAGGILVPLNDQDLVIDIAAKFDLPVILVSNFYLGSINHTLTTVESLRKRSLHVEGIIFNGEMNPESMRIILKHTGLTPLLHIPKENNITKATIRHYAEQLRSRWNR